MKTTNKKAAKKKATRRKAVKNKAAPKKKAVPNPYAWKTWPEMSVSISYEEMELEDLTADGIESGNKAETDVVSYVKLNSNVSVDENFVRRRIQEWTGPDGP